MKMLVVAFSYFDFCTTVISNTLIIICLTAFFAITVSMHHKFLDE